jgi:GntR family transcriptional regulator/MocR family aminotransferase
VLRRAAEASVALSGLARLRHPDASGPVVDGVVVGFGTPPDHGFTAAVGALCGVLDASGLRRDAQASTK